MTTESKKFRLNLEDLKKVGKVFITAFLPIFFTAMLQNIDQIQTSFTEWIATLGIPDGAMLVIVPSIVAFFLTIKQFLRDNSVKK